MFPGRRTSPDMKTLLVMIAILVSGAAQSQVVQPRLADLYSDLGIYQTAYEADGSLWVGGPFDRVGTEMISNLVRFKPDGTLDTTFAPSPDSGVIRGIDFDSSGRAYVAGSFKSIAGQLRPGLARFNAGNPRTLDATYLPQLPASIQSIESITLRSDGSLYAAYSTTGTSRGIVRLDAQGQTIPTFVVTSNNAVFPMVLSADEQHLFIGGAMSQVNGVAIPSKGQVAKLDASTGAMDMDWIPFASGSGFVRAMVPDGPDHMILAGTIPGGTEGLARVAIATPGAADIGFGPDFGPLTTIANTNLLRMPDGDLLVSGNFSTVDGQVRISHLAKLAADGTARADWGGSAPLGGSSSQTLSVSAAGQVALPRFATPDFPRSRVYALSPIDGSDTGDLVDAEFSARAVIQKLARDPVSGRVFAGAPSLEEIDGRASSALVAFQSDLTPDVTWNSNLNDNITLGGTMAVSVGPTRIAVGGLGFDGVGLQTRNLFLLDASNGTVINWQALVAAGLTISTEQVRALAIDEVAGYVYVVGVTRDDNNALLSARGLNRFSLITRLLDTSWVATVVAGFTPTLAIDGDYLYFAGVNSAIATDSSSVVALARFSLAGNGKADPSFKPFATATSIATLDIDATHVYVGGSGVLARIDKASGLIDSSWNPSPAQGPGSVAALSLADDGSVWVGGSPTLGCAGGVVDVARIQAGGVTDPTWKIDADQPVSSVLWVDGGRVLVAGSFRNVNGDPHDGIALIGPGDTIFAGEMGDPLCVRP